MLTLLTAVSAGCRSRAYQDVYTDKLTSRIRVLEDQLNEVDYTNQVLRQKLARYEARQSAERLPTEERPPAADRIDLDDDADVDLRITPDADERPREAEEGPAADLELDIDLGEPVDPDAMDRDQLPPPRDALPPIQPLPPRAEQFEMPPIELGEPLPPGEPDEEDAVPPGQIPTPESARKLYPGIPSQVAIHAGLSGRHHHDSDDVEDGLFLVLTLADTEGNPIRCEEPISIVVLDPARTGEEARLGRWDFTAKEIAEKYRETPLPSIQLPILWQEARPAGDSVAVFIRVMTPTDQPLETDMLMEFKAGDKAEWTSRGLGTHSAKITPEAAWK